MSQRNTSSGTAQERRGRSSSPPSAVRRLLGPNGQAQPFLDRFDAGVTPTVSFSDRFKEIEQKLDDIEITEIRREKIIKRVHDLGEVIDEKLQHAKQSHDSAKLTTAKHATRMAQLEVEWQLVAKELEVMFKQEILDEKVEAEQKADGFVERLETVDSRMNIMRAQVAHQLGFDVETGLPADEDGLPDDGWPAADGGAAQGGTGATLKSKLAHAEAVLERVEEKQASFQQLMAEHMQGLKEGMAAQTAQAVEGMDRRCESLEETVDQVRRPRRALLSQRTNEEHGRPGERVRQNSSLARSRAARHPRSRACVRANGPAADRPPCPVLADAGRPLRRRRGRLVLLLRRRGAEAARGRARRSVPLRGQAGAGAARGQAPPQPLAACCRAAVLLLLLLLFLLLLGGGGGGSGAARVRVGGAHGQARGGRSGEQDGAAAGAAVHLEDRGTHHVQRGPG
jgi:hypothetical protein